MVTVEREHAGLVVDRVTKRYPGGLVANDGVELAVRPGEVFGLLGPNGAGKTTLVKQIIGLLRPSAGRILLDGTDVVKRPAVARQLCSFLPQGHVPIDSFRPREVAELVGRIRGGGRSRVRQRIERLFSVLELGEWERTIGMRLSGGVSRLVGFVMAAVEPGRLVILDEPTNDVDPLRRRLLWKEIRRLGEEGSAVLLVTHNVTEAERAVDRLAVMDGGRLLAQGTPSALKAADRGQLRLELHLPPGAPDPELPPFLTRQARIGRRLLLGVAETDAAEALAWSQGQLARDAAEEYALAATSLEDVYLRLIGRDDAMESDDTPGGAG
jgi:ABC-2 type transport system ATP-binding protein